MSYLKEVISVSVPSRVALAGNPSDLAMSRGVGAVFSMLLRKYVACVSFHPSDYYCVRGPEEAAENYEEAVKNSLHQGVGNGENLFQAANVIFHKMLELAGAKPIKEPFSVYWSTTIPRQRGFSGSSALITAYLKGLLKLHQLDGHPAFAPEKLANWVLKTETEQLGTAAGLQDRVVQAFAETADAVLMDFSSAAFGRHQNEFGDYQCYKTDVWPPLALIISPAPSYSGQAHQKVKSLIQAGDALIVKQMKELSALAFEAAEAFVKKDWLALGKTMEKNAKKRLEIYGQETLGEVNLEMLSRCEQAGCFANYTGSGGAMVALLPDESAEGRLKEAFSSAKYQYEITNLAVA